MYITYTFLEYVIYQIYMSELYHDPDTMSTEIDTELADIDH